MEIEPPSILDPTKWFGDIAIGEETPVQLFDSLMAYPVGEALLIFGLLLIVALWGLKRRGKL